MNHGIYFISYKKREPLDTQNFTHRKKYVISNFIKH